MNLDALATLLRTQQGQRQREPRPSPVLDDSMTMDGPDPLAMAAGMGQSPMMIPVSTNFDSPAPPSQEEIINLAGDRQDRMTELQTREVQDPSRRNHALMGMLQGEIDADPYTGVDAHARDQGIRDAQTAETMYNLPGARQVRDDTQKNALEKLLRPEQMRGEYGNERQRIANEGLRSKGGATPPKGEILVPTMDPKTGKSIWTPRSQAAGLMTGGTGAERQAITTNMQIIDQIDELKRAGDKVNWTGIGPTGAVQNKMYDWLGVGDDDQNTLRLVMQRLRADIMFGEGGKALTASEKEEASKYLGDITSNPHAAQQKFSDFRSYIENKLSRARGQGSTYDQQDQEDQERGSDEITDENWGRR